MTPQTQLQEPPPPSHYPHSLLDFRGRYEVTMAMLNVASDQLAEVLPPDLQLEPVPGIPIGTHPLLVCFGRERGVHQILTWFLPHLNYLESVIAIPSVRLAASPPGYDGPFNWMTRLDVDHLLALLLGRLVGYPKFLSRMHGDECSYRIAPLFGGKPLVEVSRRPYGSVGPASEFPLFAGMRELLACPLISRNPFNAPPPSPGRPFLYTLFQWEIDKASLQASEVTIQVHTPDMPGLPPGEYHADGIDQTAFGGVHLHVPWEAVKPFPRRGIHR
jgi:hypothetical protein